MGRSRTSSYSSAHSAQSFLIHTADYHPAVKWLVLLAFSIANIANALCWVTYSPIVHTVRTKYDISAFVVDGLTQCYMAAFIVLVFPSMWVLEHFGLRIGVVTGAFLTAFGAAIRCIFTDISLPAVAVGQLLAAMGQPFIISAPAKLSMQWFAPEHRAVVTMLGTAANIVGSGAGTVIPPAVVNGDPNKLVWLHMYEAIIALVALLLCSLIPTRPPHMPAADHTHASFGSTFADIRWLLCDKHFVFLLMAFAPAMTVLSTVASLLGPLAEPHYDSTFAGNMGAIVIVTGLIGAGALGAFVDKTGRTKESIVLANTVATGAMILFSLVLHPDNDIPIYIACGAIGISMTASIPLSFEAAADHTYPIDESVSNGFMILISQIQIIVCINVGQKLINDGDKQLFQWLLAGLMGSGMVFSLLFRGEKLRPSQEVEKAEYRSLLASNPVDVPSADDGTSSLYAVGV